MPFIITPTYNDIFEETPPEIDELIKGVPTSLIVSLIATINSELYLSPNDMESQMKILNFILGRQSDNIKQKVFNTLIRSHRNGQSMAIFSGHFSFEFLHYALTHYYEDTEFTDTNPEQELNLFKAYLLMSQKVTDKVALTVEVDSPIDYFRKNTWPILVNQLELTNPQNYFISLIKGMCFLDFLSLHTQYKQYVSDFLKEYRMPNAWSYVMWLVNIIQNSTNVKEGDKLTSYAHFKVNEVLTPFFDSLTLDLLEYQKLYSGSKSNYNGIKDKPLIKFSADTFIVIDWNIFATKIYNGLLFDFHRRSGISEESVFIKFIDFKKYISEMSIEGHLFRKLIKASFRSKYAKVIFDDRSKDGFPDAYVRIGKKVFLFEIKDAYFPVKSVDAFDYNAIKETIDEKFNKDKKGTGQLINSIKRLAQNSLEEKSFEELKLKKRNLVIYPVLIFTDYYYGLSGMMLYLQEEFNKRKQEAGIEGSFQQIKELSFIHLDFLIANLDLIKRKESTMDIVIDESMKELKRRKVKHTKRPTVEHLFELNASFERVASDIGILNTPDEQKDFTKTIFNDLEVSSGLE